MTPRRPSRAESRARAHRINALILQGLTVDEIAAEIGITTDALWKLKKRWGFALAQKRGARRLSAWIAAPHVEALDRWSDDLPRERALADIINGILSKDPDVSRRTWSRVRRVVQEAMP